MTPTESKPLLTVIIAVFNGANTLQQCIDSVCQQTYENKEIIIIDGGSQDSTIEILKANSEQISYWVSESDSGIYNAWNKGLAKAKGDWICFLGADDYFWNSQILEKISADLIVTSNDIAVVYGKIMLINENEEELYAIGEPWSTVKERFKSFMSIPHPGAMHRKNLFDKNGGFDESFRIAGDYELLLRELKIGDAQFIPNLITVGMRQGGISSNPKNTMLALREMRRAQKINGRRIPTWLWIVAMGKIYVRYLLWYSLGGALTKKVFDVYRRIRGKQPYWTKL